MPRSMNSVSRRCYDRENGGGFSTGVSYIPVLLLNSFCTQLSLVPRSLTFLPPLVGHFNVVVQSSKRVRSSMNSVPFLSALHVAARLCRRLTSPVVGEATSAFIAWASSSWVPNSKWYIFRSGRLRDRLSPRRSVSDDGSQGDGLTTTNLTATLCVRIAAGRGTPRMNLPVRKFQYW